MNAPYHFLCKIEQWVKKSLPLGHPNFTNGHGILETIWQEISMKEELILTNNQLYDKYDTRHIYIIPAKFYMNSDSKVSLPHFTY